jgi:hypothetical protein
VRRRVRRGARLKSAWFFVTLHAAGQSDRKDQKVLANLPRAAQACRSVNEGWLFSAMDR